MTNGRPDEPLGGNCLASAPCASRAGGRLPSRLCPAQRVRSPRRRRFRPRRSSRCSPTSRTAYCAAQEMLAEELLGIARDLVLAAADWPDGRPQRAGRDARPTWPQRPSTPTRSARGRSPPDRRRSSAISSSPVRSPTLLVAGAPAEPRQPDARPRGCRRRDLAHDRLPGRQWSRAPASALSDYLAYMVLAPLIGPEAPLRSYSRSSPPSGVWGGGVG